jgi:hypothetical protein
MSILNQSSNDPSADASLPVTVVSAADMAIGGTPEVHGADEAVATEEAAFAEFLEYRHVPLPTAGTIHVRYSQIQPLRPRRFQLDDD